MHESEKWKWSRSVLPWGFPGKSTGVGCHCLLRKKKSTSFLIFLFIVYNPFHSSSWNPLIACSNLNQILYICIMTSLCIFFCFQYFFIAFIFPLLFLTWYIFIISSFSPPNSWSLYILCGIPFLPPDPSVFLLHSQLVALWVCCTAVSFEFFFIALWLRLPFSKYACFLFFILFCWSTSSHYLKEERININVYYSTFLSL